MTESALWGEFEHFVDDKGRIVMPADFRAMLGAEVVLTRGPDHALLLLPLAVWQEVERSLRQAVLAGEEGVLQRMLGGRFQTRVDSHRRIAVPRHLREWAGLRLGGRAVLIGQGRKAEIWSPEHWQSYNETFTTERVLQAARAAGVEALLRDPRPPQP